MGQTPPEPKLKKTPAANKVAVSPPTDTKAAPAQKDAQDALVTTASPIVDHTMDAAYLNSGITLLTGLIGSAVIAGVFYLQSSAERKREEKNDLRRAQGEILQLTTIFNILRRRLSDLAHHKLHNVTMPKTLFTETKTEIMNAAIGITSDKNLDIKSRIVNVDLNNNQKIYDMAEEIRKQARTLVGMELEPITEPDGEKIELVDKPELVQKTLKELDAQREQQAQQQQ